MSILSNLFGKEILVGLDIGSAAIKAVQLETTRGGFRVTRAAIAKTPVGCVRDGMVVSAEPVASAVYQMLESAGIDANAASVAISGPTVAVRQIRTTKLNETMLAKSIKYEAAKYISTNVDESALAFEILGVADDDPTQMDVMLVAAPRDLVEARVNACTIAGLEACHVDIEAFAAQRAVVDTNREEFRDDSLRALVDIGASHTEVTLISGPDFALSRSIPIAGDTFTDALKNQLRLDVAEAEARKASIDMNALVNGDGDSDQLENARIVQTTVDELLREIRRSINYFQSQLSESGYGINLSEILLTGGSSQMVGLPAYVMARLGIQARLADPFQAQAIDVAADAEAVVQEHGPALAIALGLALKEVMVRPLGGKS